MAAANFPDCLAFVLKWEGGKSNDAHDPGGRTMHGITQAAYDSFRSRRGLARRDVFTMAAAERDMIYRVDYWDAVGGDKLRDGEDLCVFDFAVNSGPARSRDVWLRQFKTGTEPACDVIHSICAYRLSFLLGLRTWRNFGGGWGRRVAACEAAALRMANGNLGGAAEEANARAGKKWMQATIAMSILLGASTAHAVQIGIDISAGGLMAAALAVVVMLAFGAWREGQRAAALTGAVKDGGLEK